MCRLPRGAARRSDQEGWRPHSGGAGAGKHLREVSFDGAEELASQEGLPKQLVVLRTYFSTSRLFHFSTYTVSSSSAFLGIMPNARIFRYRLLRSMPSASAVLEILPCCAASARRM